MSVLDKIALGFSVLWLIVAVIVYVVCYVRRIGNSRVFRDFWIAWYNVPAVPVIAMIMVHGRFYRAHASLLIAIYFIWAAVIVWLTKELLWGILVTIREKGERQ